MQQLLEIPLLSPQAADWREGFSQLPPECDQWKDAQMMSLKASEEIANFKDLAYPLTRTFKKVVLNKIWARIDQVSDHQLPPLKS